jgi:lysophospholipase L1-like esterase
MPPPLSKIFRRSRHVATGVAVTLGLVSATGVAAVLAASPASAVCGTTCGGPTPPTLPPPKTNHVAFTWTLAQTQASYMPNMDTTNESTTSPVSLYACGSTAAGGTSYPGIRDYQWTFSNGNPQITTASCTATWQRPLSKVATTVNVTLTVVPQSGSPFSLTQAVQYRDFVIAALGDSGSSGEGAPDAGQNFSISGPCDRSTLAAPAQAAVHAQQTLGSAVTVHFWFLGCTGAGILDGLINEYTEKNLPAQLDRLDTLLNESGFLSIDRLLISVGANDIYWADMLEGCLLGGLAQNACITAWSPLISAGLTGLPSEYQQLQAQLELKLGGSVDWSQVYLTQYWDPIDSQTAEPLVCAGEPAAGQNLLDHGAAIESNLGQIMQSQSTTNGWHFIGGVQKAFQGHGVCQTPAATSPGGAGRWINSVVDSLSTQGNPNGSWHPNAAGQAAIAPIIYSAISSGL